jgi:hypothetical protein
VSAVPLGRVIARLRQSSPAFNTLSLPPPVPIHLQMSPDFPQGDVRGVRQVDFQVIIAGTVVQVGQTPADGRMDVRVPPGGTSRLQLLFNGAVVAEYLVSVDSSALAAVTGIQGQQERLRLLGYHVGHGGDSTGVDGVVNAPFERSVVDFQVDHGILPNGAAAAATQGPLTTRAGG